VERSIAAATPGHAGEPGEAVSEEAEELPRDVEALPEDDRDIVESDGRRRAWLTGLAWGISLTVLCLVVFVSSNPSKQNFYIHFVWQAQSWLDGQASIPTHVEGGGTPGTPGNSWYQDVEPILDANGMDTGRGIIPFPPLPALVLLPFVAVWHLATNEQMLAAILSAADVGIAFWMLGFLPIRPHIRRLTALFLGLGTVLWYAAAIGTTWFFAHVVAVGCLLWSIGLALSADRDEAELPPLPEVGGPAGWLRSLGWRAVAALAALAASGGVLYLLAALELNAVFVVAAGVVAAALSALLALQLARGRAVLVPLLLTVAIVGGAPAVLIVAEASSISLAFVVAAVLAAFAALVLTAWSSPGSARRVGAGFMAAMARPESRQIAAGLLFGLACTARLTILFGFPFFLLVGGGRGSLRRVLLAGAGATVPLVALLVYTYASTGDLFNPAYNYLYSSELGYAQAPFLLPYHADMSIEDFGYIPQNLGIMLFSTPHFFPTVSGIFPGYGDPTCVSTQTRGLFSQACPLALPDAQGMSVILTSPAYLLAPLALIPSRVRVNHVAVASALAVGAIAFVNLMHFSQGWVQFGYRFSNDFAPFAIVLVALGANRLGRFWWLALVPLLILSIAINLWGTVWGVILGW
jgi:hypothetical protein